MPAEFEPHAATWLCWPHNRDNWPQNLADAEREFRALVELIAESEEVHVLVEDVREKAAIPNVRFHVVPSDDAWLRDTGATFVQGPRGLVALDWGFNGWGGAYPCLLDAQVGARIADLAGAEYRSPDLVTEGGALETDGEGSLLATRSSLLDPQRNPDLDPTRAEALLGQWLGIERVLWVEGAIDGDDTAGHIDNLARFVAPGHVVSGVPEAAKSLRGRRDARGRELEVSELPLPRVGHGGEPLPASYANFYVANSIVAVPRFGVAEDDRAIDVLRPLFPGRRVVGVECRTLLAGLGGPHCLTQQQPVVR